MMKIVVKKVIIFTVIISLGASCNRIELDDMKDIPKSVTKINANIADRRTRVTLDVNPIVGSDNTYWKDGDFLFVAELSEGENQFTGHILKYNYIPPVPAQDQSKGFFNGIGMVTGGKYLVVNTNISYIFIGLPQMGESFFDCTFQSKFYCYKSFGEDVRDVQQIASQLLFIGTATIPDSNQESDITLTSPMSMMELHMTTMADVSGKSVDKVTVESEDAVFSYKIYTDQSGKCQSAKVNDYYNWQKLNSEVIFTTDHSQSLDPSTPLKIRVLAFQKDNTKTIVKITVTMDDGSTLSYRTPLQNQTLIPNAVTIINVDLQ